MTPVLIVEDEDLVAKTLGRWLGACGYDLAYAANAQDAVTAVAQAPVGVAVIDVGLPGEHDGLWLVEQIRRDHPGTAVVLATGHDNLPASATMRAGVVSYLLKPFGRDQLRGGVAGAVRWHENAAFIPESGLELEQAAAARHSAVRQQMDCPPVNNATDALRTLAALDATPDEHARAVRITSTAAAMASGFSMRSADREAVYWAGRFHLLCRLTIPESVIQKAEALSPAESAIVRRGPADASALMRDHPFLAPAAVVLAAIREREDGLGYPDGLVGAAIPLGSRILAVAEALEAMTHAAPYRPARSPVEAAVELRRCAGRHFDAVVVARVLEVMATG